jgi:hypothetical protein
LKNKGIFLIIENFDGGFMKKWLVLLALCFSNLIFSLPIQDHQIDPEALSQLACALNISPEEDLIAATQKRWLRKPGQERWELEELSADQRTFVLNWAKQQGFFSPWKPNCKVYNQALILGATTPRMQTRLSYLKQLWDEGVRFQEVVWLTGDRPLDKRVDDLTDRCTNESEAAHILWKEADLPPEMKKLPVVFVAVPMKEGGKRPNTQDTLLAWLKREPQPHTALFISDQPFCGYQFAVIKASLPDSISFDVAGQGIDSPDHPAAAAIILDSIARWIYQENLIKCSNQ